jgi:hypothetical protein
MNEIRWRLTAAFLVVLQWVSRPGRDEQDMMAADCGLLGGITEGK